MRYIGAKNGRIVSISDAAFSAYGVNVIEVPSHLSSVPSKDLIVDYIVSNGRIIPRHGKKIANQLKVALVSNWHMKCGISSYGENLFPAIDKHVADVKLFIEDNQHPIGDVHQFGDKTLLADKIVSCWKRGESLNKLAQEIKNYNPDVVLINHEFGIFPDARYWLSFLTQISQFRIVVVMHSIFPHHSDKLISVAAIPNIVVHLDVAKSFLKDEAQISSNVSSIPHGCLPIDNQTHLWNLYNSDHTFLQQGFAFSYKRFETCIEAVAILKDKYPNIFFTALLAESDHGKMIHQEYYDRLIDLVAKLHIENHVAIIRGFQSDATLDAYYRTNRIAVLPYGSDPQHVVYGVSGIARLAMSKGLPVITSSAPHFSDLPTIKADGSQATAEALDKLFSDRKLIQSQVAKQNSYLLGTTWEKVALKFVEVMES